MTQPHKAEVQMLHAEICQALADPIRIMLLYQLADGPKSVGDLALSLELNQPTVSRHLKVLRDRGMANTERHGTTVMYSLADQRVIDALDLMRGVMTDNLAQKSALVDILIAAEAH
jgi:DNA-binding transcriptional ArsR family regulator